MFVTTSCSYHSPRKNVTRTTNLPPGRQLRLNFTASSGGSGVGDHGHAATRNRVIAPAAPTQSQDSFDATHQLTFCSLADVKPIRVFADSFVRAWPQSRVEAWHDRSNDIHLYLTHLPFPHDGTSTTLHMNKQWAQCESDRLLAIIDKCIQ